MHRLGSRANLASPRKSPGVTACPPRRRPPSELQCALTGLAHWSARNLRGDTMRELKIVGLDVDGKHLICEGDNPADKFMIRVDDRLRAAVRGDEARVNQTPIEIEVSSMLRPKDIQARI